MPMNLLYTLLLSTALGCNPNPQPNEPVSLKEIAMESKKNGLPVICNDILHTELRFFTEQSELTFILPTNLTESKDMWNGKMWFLKCELWKRMAPFVLSEWAKSNIELLKAQGIGVWNFKCTYRLENKPESPNFWKIIVAHIEFLSEEIAKQEAEKMDNDTEKAISQ